MGKLKKKSPHDPFENENGLGETSKTNLDSGKNHSTMHCMIIEYWYNEYNKNQIHIPYAYLVLNANEFEGVALMYSY